VAANAASFPINETSIAALHAAYLSGRATAVSVCRAHLDRIAAYDRKGPALGAIVINNPDALMRIELRFASRLHTAPCPCPACAGARTDWRDRHRCVALYKDAISRAHYEGAASIIQTRE